MIFRKQAIILLSASFFSLATVRDLNQQGQSPKKEYAEHSISDGLTREEQIQQCAGCHRKEYENEMIGPHAASYKRLVEHIDHVQSSPNFTDHWWESVKKNILACSGCHAGSNLYESVFSGLESETEESKYNIEHYPNLFAPPPTKVEEADKITGVDCLTCHVKANKVITNADFSPSGLKMSGQCDVIPSKFFSIPTLNCNSCHCFTNKNTVENVEKN